MDEGFVTQTPPTVTLMRLQEEANAQMAARTAAARLGAMTLSSCIREASAALAALYDTFLNRDGSSQDVLELMHRPNMARGIGLLLAFVAGILLVANAMVG